MQLLARDIQAGYAAVGGAVRLATGRAGSAKERKRPGMPAGRARWCRGTHGGAGAGVAPESSGLVGRTLHLHASKPFSIVAEATGVPVATISRRDIRLDRRKPGSLFSPHTSEQVRPARTPPVVPPGRVPDPRGHLWGSEHRWCRWGAAEDIHRGGRGAGSGMLPIEEGTVEPGDGPWPRGRSCWGWPGRRSPRKPFRGSAQRWGSRLRSSPSRTWPGTSAP